MIDFVVKNWILLLTCVIASWLVIARIHDLRRAKTPTATKPAPSVQDDHVKDDLVVPGIFLCPICEGPKDDMFWHAGEFKCVECWKAVNVTLPEPEPAAEAPIEQCECEQCERKSPTEIHGNRITLPSVGPGERVIAEGSNCSIHITGPVDADAVLHARGSNARIRVDGVMDSNAEAIADGSNARIVVDTAGEHVKLRAAGSNAVIRCRLASSTAKVEASGSNSSMKVSSTYHK
jgi:hypothetical protein